MTTRSHNGMEQLSSDPTLFYGPLAELSLAGVAAACDAFFARRGMDDRAYFRRQIYRANERAKQSKLRQLKGARK